MEAYQVIQELRELYSSIPMPWFMQIMQRVGIENHERLRSELSRAESETLRWLRRNQKKEERRSAFALKELMKRETHRGLHIEVPQFLDKSNVQAVIVYGFSKVGSAIYAGSRSLTDVAVRHNVEVRLRQIGLTLEAEEFYRSLAYLRQAGVVLEHPDKRGSLSLNLSEDAAAVTVEGRRMIIAVKRFFHQRVKR